MANELVKMADVLRHLDLPAGDTTYQAELTTIIEAATPIVEYITGPINPVTYTNEAYDVSGADRVMLRHVPVISVTSVSEWIGITQFALTLQPPGSTVDNYGFYVARYEDGLIIRMSAFGQPMPFLGSQLTVTYQAGRSAIPPDVKLAVLEDIRGLWQQTHNGGRPKFGGGLADEDGWTIGPLHLFPRLAAMLENKARTQSIA